MITTTKRIALGAVIVVAVFIPATAGGENQPPPTPASAVSPAIDPNCPQGRWSMKDYKKYASRVYRRNKVRRAALSRLSRMIRCQHSPHAERFVKRLRARYKRERAARALAAKVVPVRDHLRRIAQCESGGDPTAISPGGTYRGKYQFSMSTWESVGGKGDPAQASEYEQDRLADKLYRTGGPGHWPVCQGR